MNYKTRVARAVLKQYLTIFSVVAVCGPRQAGKSTLLKHELPDYQYVSFDDPKMVLLFNDDPEAFLSNYSSKVIFDEVQRVPDLLRYLKIAVDNDRDNSGKFVITGSAQFNLLKGVSESLAGRVSILTLLPFQYQEMPEMLRKQSIVYGCYPELVNHQYVLKDAWYSAYVSTYLEKDVRQILNIGDIRDFSRLLKLLAVYVSQELNYSTYAKQLGISVNTVKSWVSVLEASYVIYLLPPFYENLGKRIVKRPKLYFYDTGLVTYLTGIETERQYEQGPMAGALFENYIVSEILKKYKHSGKHAQFYYYRVQRSVEIDLIIDTSEYQHWVEIKKNMTFHPNMVKNLKNLFKLMCSGELNFHQKTHKKIEGYLIYSGEHLKISENISAINYGEYFIE